MDRRDSSELAESATEATFCRDAENPAVCVVDGFGISIRTSAGRLVVTDGIGRHRRERHFCRATHGLSRLVVMATSGSVTLDALRWLKGVGIGLVVLDPRDGAITSISNQVVNEDVRLRRAQALALGTEDGLKVARYLIEIKLAGQAAVAEHDLRATGTPEVIRRHTKAVASASSLDEIRRLEASAGLLYWSAWKEVATRFVARDAKLVPENWGRFEGRRSAINPQSARHSSDPINSLLNYCYRLLEAEAHLATVAIGLDPAFGIIHSDRKGRTSFVFDLMEAVRPLADRAVVQLVRSRAFGRRDFAEDARGVVRILAPLTHRLAEAMPSFALALAPIAEHVAQLMGWASPHRVRTPTVLTNERRLAGAQRQARRRLRGEASSVLSATPRTAGQRAKPRQQPASPKRTEVPAAPICRGCGVLLRSIGPYRPREGLYCRTCLAQRQRPQTEAFLAELDRRERVADQVQGRRLQGAAGSSPRPAP